MSSFPTDAPRPAEARESRLEGQRLWANLMAMAEIGRHGATGVDRPAFSAADRSARRLLYHWGRELGLEASQDAIGNLFLRYAGRCPELAPVLTGSHLDSQPSGGRFDGAFGVLAGLEAVATLVRAGIRPARSIDVVAWSNEEGGRFAPGAMGSQVFAGLRALPELLEVRDGEGLPLHQALAETLSALPEAGPRDAACKPAAYLEAHIEQGPRLEQAGVPVGVVSGIQGCLWLEYEVRGFAAHAGTTPRRDRRDAFEAAIRLMGTLRDLCHAGSPDCRFTVGRVMLEPNTPNTIPGLARFTVDFREADGRAFEALGQALRAVEAPAPCELAVRELFCHPPERFPASVTNVVAQAMEALHYPVFELVSGAFHDALFIAKHCPTGMVFVRCRDGISHNPAEYAEPADLAAGAQVLLQALLQLAEA